MERAMDGWMKGGAVFSGWEGGGGVEMRRGEGG